MSAIETPTATVEKDRESAFEFPLTLTGAIVGTLVGFRDDRIPLVTFPGTSADGPIDARTTVALDARDVGRDIVLVFEQLDQMRPIVLGCLRTELAPSSRSYELEADGERVVVSAKEQIVLKCGKASITLTKAGKILISGAYVSSRSSGVNRVQGGSVELN